MRLIPVSIIAVLLGMTTSGVCAVRAPLVSYTAVTPAVTPVVTTEVTVQALPADVQTEIDAIDALIASTNQPAANIRILAWGTNNYTRLDNEITAALFARYDITADSDPISTLQTLGALQQSLTDEQQIEMAPIITAIKSKYDLTVIEDLLAQGNHAEANTKITQWLFINVDQLNLATAGYLLSRFDLLASDDPVRGMQRIAELDGLLSDTQRTELLPLMQQIKTKYDLLKEPDDPDILLGVAGYTINVVSLPLVPVGYTALRVISPVELDLDTLQLSDGTYIVVMIDGEYIPVIPIGRTLFVTITPDQLGLDLTLLPQHVAIVVDLGSMQIPVHLVQETAIGVTDFTLVPVVAHAAQQINEWRAIYETAFAIMGEHGLYAPHPWSPMGIKRRALNGRIERAGMNWKSDSALLDDWYAYWRELRAVLARRSFFIERARERSNDS